MVLSTKGNLHHNLDLIFLFRILFFPRVSLQVLQECLFYAKIKFVRAKKRKLVSKLGDRRYPLKWIPEESPSSTGQRCWITSSGGDPKESATEM